MKHYSGAIFLNTADTIQAQEMLENLPDVQVPQESQKPTSVLVRRSSGQSSSAPEGESEESQLVVLSDKAILVSNEPSAEDQLALASEDLDGSVLVHAFEKDNYSLEKDVLNLSKVKAVLVTDSLMIDEKEIVPEVSLTDAQDDAKDKPAGSAPTEVTTEGTVSIESEEIVYKAPESVSLIRNLRIIDPDDYASDPLTMANIDEHISLVSQNVQLVPSTVVTAEGTQQAEAPVEEKYYSYVPGRFIVQFKSDWPHALERCAQKIFTTGESFQDYLSDGSSSIDQLNKICQVRKVKGLFVRRGKLSTQEAQTMQDEKVRVIKKRFAKRALRAKRDGQKAPELFNTYIFEVPPDSDIKKMCQLYEADPHVAFAQPDYLVFSTVFPATAPDDPLYEPLMWALNNTGQTGGATDADIDAPQAWLLNLGDNIIVAVNDTGVDYEHADLADNIWINPIEDINSNGVVDGTDTCPTINGDFNCLDDDGNGYVDDIRGYDFANLDTDPMDTYGHGTMVAGIIGAVTDNDEGIAGVAPNVKIMALKGFPDGENVLGSTSDLAEAIVYAAMNGADVINNSWGCFPPSCPSNPVAEAAVNTAYGLGAVVVFGAGNDDLDINDISPQNMQPETIAVAATDHDDVRAIFSNTGTLIDLAAPGVDVVSTWPLNNYALADGTSFAAPHVAGVAALIISEYPSYTNDQVRIILRDSTDDIDAAGFDSNTGMGRLNAQKALALTNVSPFLNPVGNKTANTGILLQFDVTAFDPRSDPVTLSAQLSGGAALGTIGATFVDNGNGSGTFSWTANVGQGGLDPSVEFTVTDSPGGFTDSETITITVNLTGATCGNNILEPPEECDDNNLVNGDGCSASCTIELCGDGDVDFGEECDDGNLIDGDGCDGICDIEFCGDGAINNGGGEECDDGNFNSGDGCSSTCLDEICGNSRVDFGEGCDDGNLVAGDGCDGSCQIEPDCGNGAVEAGEECDDGNLVDGDGCDEQCVDELCSDGIVNDGGIEECDDGDLDDGDGCSSVCLLEVCGNGITDLAVGEECDDGNVSDGDGCSSDCFLETCGNSRTDFSEECDDGNAVELDGCSSTCQIVGVCGNGVCEVDGEETCVNCQADCGYCRGLRPRD